MTVAAAYLCSPAAGEHASGDAVVIRHEPGVSLLAVIDVLGHGTEASRVAAVAVATLGAAPITRAAALVGVVHDALRGSRGAAIAIAVVRGRALDACGVGNVELRVIGRDLPIVSTPGIVGHRFGTLRVFDGKLVLGDRLACYSDGISSRVALDRIRHLPPRDACAAIMAEHRRPHDDATILIADIELAAGEHAAKEARP